MSLDPSTVAIRLLAAVAAGGMIGLERSLRGRAAGARTYALVGLASALLMVMAIDAPAWLPPGPDETRVDPTRVAQGLMTGIGFLGAGVIFRERLSVRGLTTAAAIWLTSAIGILFGVGDLLPGTLAVVAGLAILVLGGTLEKALPRAFYALHHVTVGRDAALSEAALRRLIAGHGFAIIDMHYQLTADGRRFQYRMTIHSARSADTGALAEELRAEPEVIAFRIRPLGE